MVLPVASLALAGVPPIGAGLYDPTRRRAGQGWSFLACRAGHNGPGDWIFAGPHDSAPDAYRGTLATMLAAAGVLTPGIILDPENGWPQLPSSERSTRLAELGADLRAAAVRTRVIVTSHTGFPIEPLARACGGLVVGSPQLYTTPGEIRHGWARWRAVFGRRLIPSIAGPQGTASYNAGRDTADGYRRYLDTIPSDVPGVIVWDLTEIEPWVLPTIRERWPLYSMAPWALAGALDTWTALAIGVILAVMLAWGVIRGA